MGSLERSKKKVQLWKKAMVQFLLCFVMGFFTGFIPNTKPAIFSVHVVATNQSESAPEPVEILHHENLQTGSFNRSSSEGIPVADMASFGESKTAKTPKREEHEEEEEEEGKGTLAIPRRLVIIVTPTSAEDKLRSVLLRRLADTLKLVPPPLLWVVVEKLIDSSDVSEILRRTGIMYRHLVLKENFTDPRIEMDHQRNLALKHIEHHRLSGIVHFAGLSNVYDLGFFQEIRAIEVFGTWPMAFLSANRKRVRIEGPVCDSSEVIGWHLNKMNNLTGTKHPVPISSFAFNSSILWDPERWGRTSSIQGSSQDSLKFVKKEVLEEETKLKGIPSEDCSQVLLWNLKISPTIKVENHLHSDKTRR